MHDLGKIVWTFIEKIVYTVLALLFRIIGKDLTDGIFNSFMQFVKFGIVGLSNTVISYVLYVAGLLVFRSWIYCPIMGISSHRRLLSC